MWQQERIKMSLDGPCSPYYQPAKPLNQDIVEIRKGWPKTKLFFLSKENIRSANQECNNDSKGIDLNGNIRSVSCVYCFSWPSQHSLPLSRCYMTSQLNYSCISPLLIAWEFGAVWTFIPPLGVREGEIESLVWISANRNQESVMWLGNQITQRRIIRGESVCCIPASRKRPPRVP